MSWIVNHIDLILLVLFAVTPHALAIMPKSWRTERVRHIFAVLNVIGGNYGRCVNQQAASGKPVQKSKTAADLMRK